MADDPVGGEPGAPDVSPESLHHRLAHLEGRAARLEGSAAREVGQIVAPAWRRVTRGERRWPFTATVLAMVMLQAVLPERLSLSDRWVLPAVEVTMLVVLAAADPGRIDRDSRALRVVGLLLIGTASVANAWSVVQLVTGLVTGSGRDDAATLLASGGNIWLTNVVIFAVWYWELDRGGSVARARGDRPYPDLLFTQMTGPELAPPDWEPAFVDYLYLSFTNATAFSPTDTLPLSHRAKLAMAVQAMISLVTVALVVARAVNVLP